MDAASQVRADESVCLDLRCSDFVSLIPIVHFMHNPLVVSADELLSLTPASDVRSLKTAAAPVVVQKQRISMVRP